MSTLREALMASMSKSDEDTEPEAAVAAEETPEPAPEVEAETAAPAEGEQPEAECEELSPGEERDEKGRFAKPAPASAKPATDPKAAPASATAKPAAAPKDGAAAPAAPKPPQSWKANVREKWASLPPEVQAEVARREKDVAQTLQQAAQARQFAEQFSETVRPFEAMLRAENADPLRTVGSLLQTAAALRTAPPPHKAQLVANMVRAFGVDISMLDQALTAAANGNGAAPAPAQPQPRPEQFRDPRVDDLLGKLSAAEQRVATERTTRAEREVSAFAESHEFFDDVRETMADLREVAERRGVDLPLEEAYNRAIALHPEIPQVLQQREAAKAATTGKPATLRAKTAASSVRSHPTASVGKTQPTSLREQLEAAMNERE